MPWVFVNPGENEVEKTTAAKGPELVYRLRVDLQHVRPPIWRRFTVLGSASLYQVHQAIIAVMGWGGAHLYSIEVAGTSFGDPDPELGLRSAKSVRLERVAEEGDAFTYVYDFGDDWQHTVRVEEVHRLSREEKVPLVLAGKRACPPDDVGGVWGYDEFLASVADPKHPEHQDMMEWIGGEWDPEDFRRDLAEARLRQVARRGRWAR